MRQERCPPEVQYLAPASLAEMLVAASHDTLVLIPSHCRPGTKLPCVITSAVVMYVEDTVPTMAALEASISFHERILFRQRQWCNVVLCQVDEGGVDMSVLCSIYHLLLDDKSEGLEAAPPEIQASSHDKTIFLLMGGIDSFRDEHPHLCDIHSDKGGSDFPGEYRPVEVPSAPSLPMVWVEVQEAVKRKRKKTGCGRGPARQPPSFEGHRSASVETKTLQANPSDAVQPSQPSRCPTPLPTLQQRLQVAHQRVFGSLHASPLFQVEPPSKVMPHLYLGSAQNAAMWRQLKAFNVTHVLVVGTECKAYFPGHFKYLQFDVWDRDDDTRIRDTFEPAVEFIEEAREAGSAVLVHCFCGISRSAAVVLAYLIKTQGLPLASAMVFLQAQRPRVCPNGGFMECLASFAA